MKHVLVCFFVVFSTTFLFAQSDQLKVYLIPGQGSDYRLFDSLKLGEQFDTVHILHSIPSKDTTMKEYAQELFKQIDTNQRYAIIGVSLGGMLAVEMQDLHKSEKTIIISSAKCRKELPVKYRFQKVLPLYKIVSAKWSKKGALVLQPIVEPDRNAQKETFKAMLSDKNPVFLKRTIRMILEWNRTKFSDDIIHIHGDNDHTIPVRNVAYNYKIHNGSHMMTLTRGAEISALAMHILTN